MTSAKKVPFAILFVIAIFAFLFVPVVEAQGIPEQIVPKTCTGPNCDCDDLIELFQNILNTGIYLAVVLSAILFAWAGLQYLTNATNAEGKSHAKELIKSVTIGLVIMLAAWLIVDTLMMTLQVKLSDTGIWSAVCG